MYSNADDDADANADADADAKMPMARFPNGLKEINRLISKGMNVLLFDV